MTQRVPLYVGSDSVLVDRLLAALREAGIDPVAEPHEGGWRVLVLPEAVAQGALVLAQLNPPRPSQPGVPAAAPAAEAPPPAPPPVSEPAPAPSSTSISRGFFLATVLVPAAILSGLSMSAEAGKGGAGFINLLLVGWLFTDSKKLDSPKANGFGTWALGLCQFVAAAGGAMPALTGLVPPGARHLFASFAVLVAAVAMLLALTGLFLGYAKADRFTEGRGHGIAATVFAAMLLVGIGNGFDKARQPPPSLKSELQPLPSTPLTWADLNFKITMPPSPWAKIDLSKVNPVSTVGFMRSSPEVYMMVIAEKGADGIDADAAIELWRGRLATVDPQMRFESGKPTTVGGLPALEATAWAKVKTFELVYVNWVVSHHGYLYQLLAWGPSREASAVREESRKLVEGFSIIDPERRSEPLLPETPEERTTPATPFTSADFGYRIDLPGSSWSVPENINATLPSAEYLALCQESAFVVMPFPLLGQKVPNDVLVQALAQRFELNVTKSNVKRTPVKVGAFTGEEVEGMRQLSEGLSAVRLWALTDGTTALLVANNGPQNAGACRAGLEVVTLAATRPFKAAQAPRRERTAVFFVSLGNVLAEQGKPAAAYELYRQALELDPASAEGGWGLLDSAQKAGLTKQATAVLDAILKKAPDTSPLYAVRAELFASLGKLPAAVADYERLVKAGVEDDELFTAYAELLEKQGQRAKAFTALAAYRQHRDTAAVALLEAGLLQRDGKVERAIEVLEKRFEAKGAEAGVADWLLELYDATDRHRDALTLCEKLEARGQGTHDILLEKARAQLALHLLSGAKTTLETALKRKPGDRIATEFLEHVSAMLGEGTNSAIKDPIDAVALPSLPPLAPGTEEPGANARYELRATAISFVKNKDQRTTEHARVKILTEEGVRQFSTLHFAFNPRTESAYLNSLRVLDESGAVVGTGSPSDCYLSDKASEEMGVAGRDLFVPVPALKPGVTIEFSLTVKVNEPPAQLISLRHFFSARTPTERAVLFVQGDVAGVRFESSAGLKPTKTADSLSWIVDRPPQWRDEPYSVPAEDYTPTVALSDASLSWDGELATYRASLEALDRPTPELTALAKKLTEGLTTREAKIAALSRYVQKTVTYKAIEFGRGARVPRAPMDVNSNRYGDCKDHSLLLKRLLAAVGIDSSLALLRTWGPVWRQVPDLDQFNHMIVYVPGEGQQFFDATDKFSDLPSVVHSGFAGQDVLLVEPGPARFVKIPTVTGNGPEAVRVERTVTVGADARLDVQEQVTLRGPAAAAIRSMLSPVEAQERKLELERWLGGDLRITTMQLDDLEEPARPLKVKLRYSPKISLHEVDGDWVGTLPMQWERRHFWTPDDDERRSPFRLRAAYSVSSTSTVAAPSAREIVTLQPRASSPASAEFGTWKLATEPGPKPTIQFAFQRVSGEFPASAFGRMAQHLQDASAALDQPLVVKRSVRPAPDR